MPWGNFPARAPETTRGARVLPRVLPRRCAANMRHRRVATGSIVSIQINLLAEHESIDTTRFYYGAHSGFDHSCWSYRRRNCETVDAGEEILVVSSSRFCSASLARSLARYLGPIPRLVQGRTTSPAGSCRSSAPWFCCCCIDSFSNAARR